MKLDMTACLISIRLTLKVLIYLIKWPLFNFKGTVLYSTLQNIDGAWGVSLNFVIWDKILQIAVCPLRLWMYRKFLGWKCLHFQSSLHANDTRGKWRMLIFSMPHTSSSSSDCMMEEILYILLLCLLVSFKHNSRQSLFMWHSFRFTLFPIYLVSIF